MDFLICKKIWLILFLCGLALGSARTKIDAVIKKASQKNVTYGVEILNCQNGQTVYAYNEDVPLIPASNMKIFTSAAAMKVLGGDYMFRTGIYYSGGDLIVKGSGDPLLGDRQILEKEGKDFGWEIEAAIKALKEKGITEVKDIIVDSSVFDDMLVNPSWPANELNRDYSAEVSGINYNGNCIDITVFPSGGRAAYSITPDTGYVDITNKASVTSEKKNTVWVSRLPESNKMTLYGKCYTKTVPFQVTVHRPAVFFGYILAEKLIKNSIGFSGNIIEKMQKLDTSAREVIVFERPFRDVLTRCNQDSFNLAAEALAKKVSAAKTTGGIGGQWKHAGQVIEQLMKQAGIETKGFVFDDGCGLSRKNRVTAEMISRLLYDVFDSPQKQIFIDSLAIGGVEGSSPVSRYFREPAYKGKIFAKSGTISGVKALSGYCCTEDGTYIFSIITNNANWQTRASINEIVMSIFEF